MEFLVRKEGIAYYGISFVLFIIFLFLFPILSILFFVLMLFFLWFFRDPKREIPDYGIVSPADGKIIELEERENEYFIAIFMSPLNVHINRAPISGKIIKVEYKKGKKYPADKKEASLKNESNTFFIESEKFSLKVKQIAGILARRIVSFKKEGDFIKKGERIGLIKFGSRVELSLPKNLKILPKRGEKIYAGSTVIAEEKET